MHALLILQVIVTVFLIVIILMQKSTNDGIISGTGNSLMSGKAQANMLTRTTSILAAIFMLNSLLLAYLAAHSVRESGSIADRIPAAEAPAAPAEGTAPAAATEAPAAVPAATDAAPATAPAEAPKAATTEPAKPAVPLAR